MKDKAEFGFDVIKRVKSKTEKIKYKYYLAQSGGNLDMNVVAKWRQIGDARSF